jgi:hypothetical protein
LVLSIKGELVDPVVPSWDFACALLPLEEMLDRELNNPVNFLESGAGAGTVEVATVTGVRGPSLQDGAASIGGGVAARCGSDIPPLFELVLDPPDPEPQSLNPHPDPGFFGSAVAS